MIKSVALTNFKRHSNLCVDFKAGVNIICGRNYAGKSTVLHAILFALWGVSAVPGGSNSAWKKGTKSTKVVLLFVINNTEIEISRTKTGATLLEGGEVTAQGTSAVNSRVTTLLGMYRGDFSRLKYSEQKETAALLSDSPTLLNELIERVSGADLIADILQRVKTIKVRKEGALESLTFVDTETLSKELKDTKTKGEAAGSILKGLKKAKEEAHKVWVSRSDALATAITLNKEQAELRAERTRLGTIISENNKTVIATEAALRPLKEVTLARQTEAEEALMSFNDSVKLRVRLRREVAEASELVSRAETSLETLQDSLTGKQQALRDLHGSYSKLLSEAGHETFETLKEVYEFVKAETTEVGRELEALTTLVNSAFCPTCHREYEDSKDLADNTLRMREISEEFDKLCNRESSLLIMVERVQANREKARGIETDIATGEADLPRISAELRRVKELLTTFTYELEKVETLDLSESRLQSLKTVKAKAVKDFGTKVGLEKVLTTALGAVERSATALEGLKIPSKEVDISRLQAPAEAARRVLDEAVTAEATAILEVNAAREAIRAAQKALDTQTELNLKARLLEAELAQAKGLQKFLRDNRENFLSQTWGQLLARASFICSSVTDGAIASLKRSGTSFTYMEEGVEMVIPSASGAQKSLMGLAMKVALAESVNDSLNCLLLDEITADMDEAHALAVTSLLGSLGPQIISISHRDLEVGGIHNIIHIS